MEIVAVVSYVIPVGDCPMKSRVVRLGADEPVEQAFLRSREGLESCDVISIELKEVE